MQPAVLLRWFPEYPSEPCKHIHAARKYVHPEQYNHLHSGVRQELSVQWTVPER